MMKRQELAKALAGMGLKKNDIVLLHSALSSLGEVEDGADGVIDAFMQVLGKGGTLIVPVFGKLGVITERLKERPDAVVSNVPVGTLAAIGGRAKELLADHWEAETAHGEGTPFLKIARAGGYVCLLGVDQDRNTMLHSAEALLELPYLGSTTQSCTNPKGRTVTRTWRFYPGPHRNFIGLDRLFAECGAMTVARIGNAQVRLLKAKEMLEVAMEVGGADPAFALCDNPACADCVRQRAAIDHALIAAEAFTLSVSSRLAGRYVPEMIENMQRCGLDHVEFDYIQGKACATMTEEALADAARQFANAGMVVTALRAAVPPNDYEALAARCRAAKTKRLILPLTARDVQYKVLKKAGLSVVFANCNQSALQAAAAYAEQTKAAAEAKVSCAFVMNPAGFALAGENPFLSSWRAGKFVRVIGQLDVCDALWDGTPTGLAQGNAEIHELISILRCRNFDGVFTLGGGAAYPGTLPQAAQEFIRMLE